MAFFDDGGALLHFLHITPENNMTVVLIKSRILGAT